MLKQYKSHNILYRCSFCGVFMMCEICHKRPAIELHHMFSQSKVNKKYYGKGNSIDGIDWINDARALKAVCRACHDNSKDNKLTEIQFARLMGIKPRSKTGRLTWFKITGEII